MKYIDILIIGGGCAGLTAALSAKKEGFSNILIIERNNYLGGILQQCIHNGFGLHYFQKDLTGVEFAKKLVKEIQDEKIPAQTETNVLKINKNKTVKLINQTFGVFFIKANSIIISTGCRERTREEILIPGTRPAGIFTAGTAQRYLNHYGYLVGKKVFIVGSGDIGLIMARQFILEGAEILGVAEIKGYSSGLARNIVQCLEDYNIPLYYKTTVVKIEGKQRVSGIWLAEIDKDNKIIENTMKYISCDTLILAVGLIPQLEFLDKSVFFIDPNTGGCVVDDRFESNIHGVFSCGNSLHVNNLVDYVAEEGIFTGQYAAKYIKKKDKRKKKIVRIIAGKGLGSIIPQKIIINSYSEFKKNIKFRPNNKTYNSAVSLSTNGKCFFRKRFSILTPGEIYEVSIDTNKIETDIKLEITYD